MSEDDAPQGPCRPDEKTIAVAMARPVMPRIRCTEEHPEVGAEIPEYDQLVVRDGNGDDFILSADPTSGQIRVTAIRGVTVTSHGRDALLIGTARK